MPIAGCRSGCVSLLALVVFLSSTADAQVVVQGPVVKRSVGNRRAVTRAYYPYFNGYGRYQGHGYGGYGGRYRASTAAEGYARGVADALRAQGQKNYLDAAAAERREDARAKYLQNRVRAVDAYYDRKRLYDEYHAEQRYREAERRQRRLQRQLLAPLSPAELDPTTGVIRWPLVLDEPRYAAYTDPLCEVFLRRGRLGGVSSRDYLTAKQLIKEFRAVLAARRELYPPAALQHALRFLLKLDRELDHHLG